MNPTDTQPDPIKNTQPAVWDVIINELERSLASDIKEFGEDYIKKEGTVAALFIKDCEDRDLQGRERYGVALQPFNGRNALVDAYQEQLDLCAYLKQDVLERPEDQEAKKLYEEAICFAYRLRKEIKRREDL